MKARTPGGAERKAGRVFMSGSGSEPFSGRSSELTGAEGSDEGITRGHPLPLRRQFLERREGPPQVRRSSCVGEFGVDRQGRAVSCLPRGQVPSST